MADRNQPVGDRPDTGQPFAPHQLQRDYLIRQPQASDRIEGSAWIKVLIGALTTPLVVVAFLVGQVFAGAAGGAWITASIVIPMLVCAGLVGGALGALLALKDYVDKRLLAGQPITFPLRLFFGYGLWSLLAVWLPLAFFGVIGGTILLLA